MPPRMRLDDRQPTKGDTVYDIGNSKRLATIIVLGVQVSEVRWHDNKATQYLGNEFLRKVECHQGRRQP